jgi:hypothetical protein
MTNLYDISRSIIRIETLVKFCESKIVGESGGYYRSHLPRFERRLERLKNAKQRIIDAEIKRDIQIRL